MVLCSPWWMLCTPGAFLFDPTRRAALLLDRLHACRFSDVIRIDIAFPSQIDLLHRLLVLLLQVAVQGDVLIHGQRLPPSSSASARPE
jgi:hypothetical protein